MSSFFAIILNRLKIEVIFKMTDKEILDGVLAEFANLAAIPRKSGHEQAVSNFLKQRAESFNCTAVQDERYNLIIDKPAAKGCEAWPQVILQGHMDMVCVAAEGVDFDPLKDAIKIINDGEFLRADGTSLGADDGIGVAAAMFLLQQDFQHGPIRAIFTVDEEVGMTGAKFLDPKYLADAKYLINCDSEDIDILTLSSAGSVNIDAERRVKWRKPEHRFAYKFTIKDLHGGHSGESINSGYANAVKIAAQAIHNISKKTEMELASFTSLKARNVIPSEAEFVFTTPLSDVKVFNVTVSKINAYLKAAYPKEEHFTVKCEACAIPEKVMSYEDMRSIVDFINLSMTGVLKMSQSEEGLVELSANIGPVVTKANSVAISVFPRSAVDALILEMTNIYIQLGKRCGVRVVYSDPAPGWPVNPHSQLKHVVLDTFKEQNGFDMKAKSIHAGLECSYFYAKNPHLDMISIGPNNVDIHSPKEHLELKTLVPFVKLIQGTMEKLAK